MAFRKITNEMGSLRRQISKLKKTAHEPREFVRCNCCKKIIKEK